MWIIKIALERPYTFIVLAIILLILGPLAIYRTPTDIFPDIGIPVVSVIWNYSGMPADEMSQRIVGNYERVLTTTVTDIEHTESQTLSGISVIKVFFQPNVNLELAISQITAISQTALRAMPLGTQPPLILNYNASTVPIIQLTVSSDTASEQKLNDTALNLIRPQLSTIAGAAAPYPYGGKSRQIQVDLNLQAMQTYGVTPEDINTAVAAQNLVLPAGTQKIGPYEYEVSLNASPLTVDGLNDLPLRENINGNNNSVLYVGDVAHIRDGFAPQTNLVRINGAHSVLMTILKIGKASTLDIISGVKNLLPQINNALPPEIKVSAIGDQSLFVKAAISGVMREGAIAAALTGLMILLFLGSWRSTLIITLSIPLSILASIIAFSSLGETINIMTLGGLALAVGILVDDATVTIENINSHLEEGKEVEESILEGARQIAVPAFVSTLCICIVFVPMFFLSGVAKFLFVPMAEAVVFAMLASYILSRTFVPTMAKYLLRKHEHRADQDASKFNMFQRFQHKVEDGFEWLRDHYYGLLQVCIEHGKVFIGCLLGFFLISVLVLFPWLGTDFFPSSDAGQIKLHYRAQPGTRIEENASIADQVDAIIRDNIPPKELDSIVDNLGIPNSGINLSYSTSAPVGPADNDILISLKEGHKPTPDYVRKLRTILNDKLPGITFAFLPADIVGQILNFGLPAPIDIQVSSRDPLVSQQMIQKVLEKVKMIPGIVDARVQQSQSNPRLHINANRSKARQLGITQKDIATNLLISLSGSFQTAPAFWLDPKNGISYNVVTQAPQYRLDSLEALRNIPIAPGTQGTNTTGPSQQILGSIADITRESGPTVVSHYNVSPIYDVYASVQDRDLGSVSKDINKVIAELSKNKPKDMKIIARGQMLTQQQSFEGLYSGLAFAIILVYLLIVVNFQSWLDPFIIITGLPAALAGIVWMLFITHTTLSVPALTGAIMCIGVATANSILIVSFAREHMDQGNDAKTSALEAGFSRLRPVMMTALAMMIGMVPMALNMGEGGEQNAPLGRAVIGGLLFSTMATLFFVPVVLNFINCWLEKRPGEEYHYSPKEQAA
jgi:CzcA family heavy metal efflux pump